MKEAKQEPTMLTLAQHQMLLGMIVGEGTMIKGAQVKEVGRLVEKLEANIAAQQPDNSERDE